MILCQYVIAHAGLSDLARSHTVPVQVLTVCWMLLHLSTETVAALWNTDLCRQSCRPRGTKLSMASSISNYFIPFVGLGITLCLPI